MWYATHYYMGREYADAWVCEQLHNVGRADCEHDDPLDVFFVRYSDAFESAPTDAPSNVGFHIRVRSRPRRLTLGDCPGIAVAATEAVYSAETDRYGGPVSMKAAEKVFGADSAAVVALMFNQMKNAGTISRPARFAIACALGINYCGLFGDMDMARDALADAIEFNDRTNEQRRRLAAYESNLGDIADAAGRYAKKNFMIARHRREILAENGLLRSSNVILSLIHMMCNRCGVFGEDETMLYALLSRSCARGGL